MMDIENMHPFCLPFGLCHDATSSSITADLVAVSNNQSNNSPVGPSTGAGTTNLPSASPLSPTSRERRLSSQRSKNLSPSDELFKQLNSISSTTVLGQSLLNHHDLIIGASASLDIIADESFYSSMGMIDDDVDAAISDVDGLDEDDEENRLRKSSITTDVEFAGRDQKREEDEDPIDWYQGEYSLFSPTRRKSLSSSAAAAIRATNLLHHQVFQHLVDPIDIKSSPTLAQLNLNSTDNDPIDGFWDTTTALSYTNPSSLSSAPTNTDLLSNCTSINKNSLTAGTCCSRALSNQQQHHHSSSNQNQIHTNSDDMICNHMNDQSQAQHHHTHHSNLTASYSLTTAHLTKCPQQSSNHQQQQSSYQQQQQMCLCPNSSSSLHTSTCLASAPFRDAQIDLQHHHQPTCCANQQSTISTSPSCLSNSNVSNLKPTGALNELNQQRIAGGRHQPNASAALQQRGSGESDTKQRPPSPALVTSSSSPLSSSSVTTPIQQQQQSLMVDDVNSNSVGENNKLKENIEYLTALLCNGNKLENSNQQPSSISSSIARSYTTLAHTLSTGPKLLERSLQPDLIGISSHQVAGIVSNQPTNEAAPCMDATLQANIVRRPQHPIQQQQLQQQQQQPPPPPPPPQQPHWVKVESSISAADSTETQTVPCAMQACRPGALNAQCLQNHHQSQPIDPKHLPQQQRAPDLRVLSSLLSGGKNPTEYHQGCTSHYMAAPSNLGHIPCAQWSQIPHLNNNQPQPAMQIQAANHLDAVPSASDASQQKTPIPPNGRPITLTPITNHNNPILQQQAQTVLATSKAIKPSPFIQPASPSASSTASSGTNTDIGPTSSGQTIKKPRLSHNHSGVFKASSSHNRSSAGGSSRSVRPNSMSTECSLSSHDEGFSSQMDNDDNNSNRYSDDEDEVDSDDESFYGDYTNNDLIGASISDDAENKWTLNMGRTRRNGQKRYFWQYNVQSKGPKGTRICSADDSENPFVLPEASDPVFSNDCQVEGVKHSGKARRGDGNDLTPNPKKLLMIGLELKKLGKIINELAPVTDLPINARTKTRKEKNKLASRACRLKKKAQHEANKIKLYGLQREHQQVVLAIYDVRKLLNQTLALKDNSDQSESHRQTPAPGEQPSRIATDNRSQSTIVTTTNDTASIGGAQTLTTLGTTNAKVFSIAEQCSMRVAGQTSDFVNSILEKVVSGCIDGGLDT